MSPAANDWSHRLLEARKALKLTRSALASLAQVSPQTIKAYEHGLRHPTRHLLGAILDALKLDRLTRNEVLEGVGFAPDGRYLGPGGAPGYMYTLADAHAHADSLPWPSFWAVDLEREFPDPIDRNMLGLASNPRFGDRIDNWDEMVGVGIAVFKGHHLGPESIENASPYFGEVMRRFVQGSPEYAARFGELWQTAEPHSAKVRWVYPVRWKEPDVGLIDFVAVVTTANEEEGLAFNDWIPVGAESWANLTRALEDRD
jgi:transcriptional regulator with XRE-family HTH domain